MEGTFRRVAGAASADVDGELVVISPADRRCFALNGSAAAVWAALPSSSSAGVALSEILDHLASSYDFADRPVALEVSRLLAEMIESGVATTVS